MTQGSHNVRTTVPLPINMRANNKQSILHTVVPTIPKTDMNKRLIFERFHCARRITFKPQTRPIILGSKLHSHHQSRDFRLINRNLTEVTSKSSKKRASEVTKNPSTRGNGIDNRAVRISLNPIDGGRLPNNSNYFFNLTVWRRN